MLTLALAVAALFISSFATLAIGAIALVLFAIFTRELIIGETLGPLFRVASVVLSVVAIIASLI